MNTSDRLPVHKSLPDHNETLKPHHSAHYYAHRVPESLTTSVSKIICATFLIILFLAGLVAFILWLSLRPHRPRFFISNFSIPGLDKPDGFEHTQIILNVTARNSNQHLGLDYGKVEGWVYYRERRIGHVRLEDAFYQEPKNTTVMSGVVSGTRLYMNHQRWTELMHSRAHGRMMFRLEIRSDIRFKVWTWHSQHHRMHANCAVGVGPDGSMRTIYRSRRCPVYFT